ncbi:hypothetical protein CSUI_001017 [Cystoisospora suis]|uniref:Uncharacterized protein n=1 Tax=Cystoisospora suis TaxID=483139 RepID=A0A2C6KYX1_9APIC|nr:hypothetical protein CSUI_001017 [Cystoisospora suis]
MAHMHLGGAVPLVFRRFPSIYGRSLAASPSSSPILLPDQLPGALKLLLVCFTKKQHLELDTWLPHLRLLKRSFEARHQNTDVFKAYRIVIRSRSARLVRRYLEDRWRILLDPLPALPSSSSSPSVSSSSFSSTAVGCSDQDTQGKELAEEAEDQRPGERKDKEKKKKEENRDGGDSDEEEVEEEAMRKRGDEYDVFSDPSCCYFSYLHKRQFLSEAYLPDCQRPYLFLVNEESKILWCEHEAFSPSKKTFGLQQIQDLLQISPSFSSSLRLPPGSSSSLTSSCSSLPSHPIVSIQPSTVH